MADPNFQDIEMEEKETEIITIEDDEVMVEAEPVPDIEQLKLSGNNFYKQQDFTRAIALYTMAIELAVEDKVQSAILYGNRAAAYISLARYQDAIKDCEAARLSDPDYSKALPRLIKCHTLLGNLTTANQLTEECDQFDTDPLLRQEIINCKTITIHYEAALKALKNCDYPHAKWRAEQMMREGVVAAFCKTLKAECLAHLNKNAEAQELANSVLVFDPSNIDAIYVRCLCLYRLGNLDKAYSEMQRLRRMDPDNTKITDVYRLARNIKVNKDAGNAAFRAGQWSLARDRYTDALGVDQSNRLENAKLYYNRATVSAMMGQYAESLLDCKRALELDSTYLKPKLREAQCYMDLEKFEEAVRAYAAIQRQHPSRDHEKKHAEAKLALKLSKSKDYYKILNVPRSATIDEIKKAYKRLAKIQHPDRHSAGTPEERAEAEKRFKETEEAHRILTDERKRKNYDSGVDIDDMREEYNPYQFFHASHQGYGGYSFFST